MPHIYRYALLLASMLTLSACGGGSGGPTFEVELTHKAIGRPQIYVVTKNAQVIIEKVVINDGEPGCRVIEAKHDFGIGSTFPLKLKLGQGVTFAARYESCTVFSATLVTDLGEVTYTFGE